MGDSDIPLNRRKVIKAASAAIGVGALSLPASAAPSASRKRKRGRPSDVVQQVRHDDGFRTLRKRLVRNHVIPKLNDATVSDHEEGKLVAIPTMSPGRHAMEATIQAGVQDTARFSRLLISEANSNVNSM